MKRAGTMIAVACALGLAALSGCTVDGVGVDGGVGVGYVGDYYEPYGYDYGGWGPGYDVGPYRDGHGGHYREGHGDPHRDGGHAPAFRPPPRGRSMPSIPSHPRGR